MPWSQSDADTLRSAIAAGRGVRSLTFGDQTVQFNSLAEMVDLLARIEREVNATAGTYQARRYASVSKGV